MTNDDQNARFSSFVIRNSQFVIVREELLDNIRFLFVTKSGDSNDFQFGISGSFVANVRQRCLFHLGNLFDDNFCH